MLTVWGRICSINVRTVILAAQWLGLDFKRTDAGSQFGIVKSPAYLAMNPNAQVAHDHIRLPQHKSTIVNHRHQSVGVHRQIGR